MCQVLVEEFTSRNGFAAFCGHNGVTCSDYLVMIMVRCGMLELRCSFVFESAVRGCCVLQYLMFWIGRIVGRELRHLDDIVRMNRSTEAVHEARGGQGRRRKRRGRVGLEAGLGVLCAVK